MRHEPVAGVGRLMGAGTADQPVSRFDRWRQRATDALADATERVPVVGTIVAAAERERATGGGLLAGGVAYRLFFWIVPLGLAAAAMSSVVGFSSKDGLETAAGSRGLGPAVAAAERQAMEANESARWYLLAVGAALAVWFGIGVVRALTVVHALAWEQRIPKLRRPLVAGALFTVVAALLTVSASGLGKALSRVGLGTVALLVSLILVYTAVAFFIAIFFPHGDAPPRALLPGCLLLSVGGLGVHAFVNVYLAPKLGRSVDMYGLLGAATVILLWLFVIARLITVSAFLNAALWRDRNLTPALPEGQRHPIRPGEGVG